MSKKIKFICNECDEELPHFKGLIDHYQEYHPELLKRYEIRHKSSGSVLLIYSPNSEMPIEIQGWKKEDCKIKEYE